MRTINLSWDVSHLTPYTSKVNLCGSLFLPDEFGCTAPATMNLVVCLHGGSCSRSHFHPPYLDSSYSFAEFMTQKGYLVLALDNLGMGESSRPEPESKLTLNMIAEANHLATQQCIDGLRSNQWGLLAESTKLQIAGLGHSMGGMLATYQQAHYKSFDQLIVAGWSNLPLELAGANIDEMKAALSSGGYIPTDRTQMRALFHLPNVPDAIVTTDDQHSSLTPVTLATAALTSNVVVASANNTLCPVLLVYGEVDVSPAPDQELGFFPNSSQTALTLVADSAHMHNFANARTNVWQGIDQWIQKNQARALRHKNDLSNATRSLGAPDIAEAEHKDSI